jgi:thioredoxin reductase
MRVLLFFAVIVTILPIYAADKLISIEDSIDRAVLKNKADWLIVGGGPAGIITVGVLMDVGVDPKKIVWVDPQFDVGRMGQFYANVEGNNIAKEFVKFINACATFQECVCPAIEALKKIDPNQPCKLDAVVEPLRCISAYLRTKVISVQDSMTKLVFFKGKWHVRTKQRTTILARHVVLATGSHPRTLDLAVTQNIIPLDYALDPVTLQTLVTPDDIIGIVGGAHSAILLLKYLSTMNVKHVYNFYRHPLTYALGEGCWAKDQLGVKGTTGEWAKNVLELNPPANITRIQFKQEQELPNLLDQKKCNKLIYAIGYEPNELPLIQGMNPTNNYGQDGMIAPRLFGIGIAFPEYKIEEGNRRYAVGLNCFMDYAQRMIPQWTNSRNYTRAMEQKCILSTIDNLLSICVL